MLIIHVHASNRNKNIYSYVSNLEEKKNVGQVNINLKNMFFFFFFKYQNQ